MLSIGIYRSYDYVFYIVKYQGISLPLGLSFLDLFADDGLSDNTRCKVELFDVVTCSSLSKNGILKMI